MLGPYAFAVSEEMLVIGGKRVNPVYYLFKSNSLNKFNRFEGNNETQITAVAVSRKNILIASGYKDGNIIIWNLAHNLTGNQVAMYQKEEVTNISFIGDDQRVVVATIDGKISLLNTEQSRACQLSLQTVILNLKSPLISYSNDKHIISVSSNTQTIVAKVGRSIEKLTTINNLTTNKYGTTVKFVDKTTSKLVLYTDKYVVVHDYDEYNVRQMILEINTRIEVAMSLYRQQISSNSRYNLEEIVVIYITGEIEIFAIDGRSIMFLDETPIRNNLERFKSIQICQDVIYFFSDSEIVDVQIPEF